MEIDETIEYEKIWKCNSCGNMFVPKRPDFTCPECKNTYTVPTSEVSDKPRIDHSLESALACQKCGTSMRVGFIVERNTPLHILTLGEGLYWSPGEAGVIGSRIGLVAYACPNCGYIEHYVRRLEKDRNKILSAPVKL